MPKVNKTKYYLFENTVTVSFASKTITIHRDDPRFVRVLEAIRDDKLDAIPGIADNESREEIRHLLKIGKPKLKGSIKQ